MSISRTSRSAPPTGTPARSGDRKPCSWPISAAARATSRLCASIQAAHGCRPRRCRTPGSASPATPSIFASPTIWFRLGSARAPAIGPLASSCRCHRTITPPSRNGTGVSLLKDARTLGELRQLVRHAERPQEIEDLIHLIEGDLGYELYQAISKTKLQLSVAERAT